MTTDRLVDKLIQIKADGGLTYQEMAEGMGLHTTTLYRVMNRQRVPSGEVMAAILTAYPELLRIFLPADVPDGTPDLPNSTVRRLVDTPAEYHAKEE